MPDYKVKFEVFEGPLDLLLYLIKKEEVDIYQVNLTQIATQFIEHIEVMRMLDLEIAGEFLVMAATLMYIKSRELLPVDKQVVVTEEEEDAEDPRWELIRQLVEYKKFKDAAGQLAQLETRQEGVFARVPGIVKFEAEPEEDHRPQASIFDLINAVNAILKRHEAPENEDREIYAERWTVSEKIEILLKTIAEKPVIKFSDLFASAQSRGEVVVTFLAMLELIRLHHLMAVQSEAFGEIEITRPPASTEQAIQSSEALAASEPASTAPDSDSISASSVEQEEEVETVGEVTISTTSRIPAASESETETEEETDAEASSDEDSEEEEEDEEEYDDDDDDDEDDDVEDEDDDGDEVEEGDEDDESDDDSEGEEGEDEDEEEEEDEGGDGEEGADNDGVEKSGENAVEAAEDTDEDKNRPEN